MRTIIVQAAAAIVTLTSLCAAAAPAAPATIGTQHMLYSDVLKEERSFWVHLPESYAAGQARHPVVYLLDGESNFRMAAGVVHFLSGERDGARRIPEPIIVAVNNTDRVRDLTPTVSDKDSSGFALDGHENAGGAHNFLQFLERELVPLVARSYRVSDRRVLVGHSYGGLFALYTFLERPSLFQGIVAIDPSLYFDDKMLVKRAQDVLAKPQGHVGRVYIAIADHPDTEEFTTMIDGINRFAEILERAPSARLHSKLQLIEGETHSSVGLLGLYYGLPFAFGD